MMRKLLIASAVAVGTMLGFSGQASAACGTVSIAEMNWASAQLMANVDKIILESGYGCKVDIVPGDTMPTFTSMNEKGQPDVAGELWVNAVATPLDAAKAEGRLHTVSERADYWVGRRLVVATAYHEEAPRAKNCCRCSEPSGPVSSP
jgi:glycine betaine/proline transport system substrate-binding protein